MKNIRRIGVGSLAINLAGIYALMGLVFGVIFTLFLFLFGSAPEAAGQMGHGFRTFGLASVIFMPLLYGVIGAVGGALTALLYNAVAYFTGGIAFQVTEQSGE